MDLVADEAMDAEQVSVKNLVIWPALFLIAGLAWAQSDGTPLPTPPPIAAQSPTPQIQPTLTPVAPVSPTATVVPIQRNPPVASAPPGMIYDPAHNVYRYPPRHP